MEYMFFRKFNNPASVFLFCIGFMMITFVGCESNSNKNNETKSNDVASVIDQAPKIKIGDVIFEVELAINPTERSRGLSGRNSLEKNSGMLFVFDKDSATQFWMYGMKFSLDLVWISNSCEIVDITYSAEYPENPKSSEGLVLYSSKSPATYTLEINAGEVNLHDINIGGLVEFLNFPKGSPVNC